MCGRFSFVVKKEKVHKLFPEVSIEGDLDKSYNIAPTQQAYVITNKHSNILQKMRWGLIPHWSKDGKGGGALINARMETIQEKPSFRDPIHSYRCVVLADSFYEWRTEGGKKIPYRILLRNGDIMVFAGIWDVWQNLSTFSIITTEPNVDMSQFHDRMPVILNTDPTSGLSACEKWLSDTNDIASLLSLCEKPKNGFLHIYKVSEKLNAVKNNFSDLHKEKPEELTLF